MKTKEELNALKEEALEQVVGAIKITTEDDPNKNNNNNNPGNSNGNPYDPNFCKYRWNNTCTISIENRTTPYCSTCPEALS